MHIEPGIIIVGIAVVIFYFRSIQLRGRKKKTIRKAEEEKLSPQQLAKKKKAQKYGAKPLQKEETPQITYQIKNWWIFGVGIVLSCLAVAVRTSTFVPQPYAGYWWVAGALGILILTFSLK